MFKLLLLFVVATFVGPALCNDLQGRILGGKIDNPLKYRYHVAILIRETENSEPKYKCGGAIIDRRFVLTAAHCVYNIPSNRVVIRGGKKDAPPKDKPYLDQRIFRNVAKVMYPILYTNRRASYKNDIAVLKVVGAFDLGDKYGVTKLSLPENTDYENVNAVVMGYGAHNKSAGFSKEGEDFKSLEVKILSNEFCERENFYEINPAVLCTQPIGDKGHTCDGDGGSPLVYDNKIILGVSTDPEYCELGKPELYARVSFHKDFIKDRLNGLFSHDVKYL